MIAEQILASTHGQAVGLGIGLAVFVILVVIYLIWKAL